MADEVWDNIALSSAQNKRFGLRTESIINSRKTRSQQYKEAIMAEDVQKVRETTTQSGDTVQKTTEASNSRAETEHHQNVAERVVWFVAGILLVLLGFRFLLSLLGANNTNGFANFIYSTSHPFVSPFFSLFSYKNYSYGVSRFEIYTLVAMIFYAVVAWGIAKLVTLNRD
jgi:hypothetical protein